MERGARHLRKDDELERQILDALSAPLSPRELFLRIGYTAAITRAFNRLCEVRKVDRFGARCTFDHGYEVLYVRAEIHNA